VAGVTSSKVLLPTLPGMVKAITEVATNRFETDGCAATTTICPLLDDHAGASELWELMNWRRKMIATTRMAMRIAMTTSWLIVSPSDRFGESFTETTLGCAPRFFGCRRSDAVMSKVPRGSEVGEIPTLSRNCKWSCIKTM
jgi:hypothetical protein